MGVQVPEPKTETVTLSARPFGMAPSKEPGLAGYVVGKVAAGKPADAAGIEVGWKVATVGTTPCKDIDFDEVQNIMKSCPLPVKVVFELPAPETVGDEEDEEELDICARADQRMQAEASLANIDDLPVRREPDNLPDPIKSWADACTKDYLNKPLVDKLVAAGLIRPTLIQRHAIPMVAHQGPTSGGGTGLLHDLVALAQTGSGKTFAFVIPVVARLLLQGCNPRPFFPGKSPGCPLMLVLSPTRELAMQTNKEIGVLARGTKLQSVVIYGGETLKYQQQRIEKTQIDILCATPGRLVDLIDAGAISLSFVETVVFDEADMMLDQGLEVVTTEILTARDMPSPSSGRQTLLFSATMPQKIQELCPQILRQDRIAKLIIGNYGGDQGGSCESIRQVIKFVPDENERMQVLVDDLRRFWVAPGKKGRVVVFTNQRLQAGFLSKHLETHGFSVAHLHGKLEQHVREEVFSRFRRGEHDVLVATNVASRGLDFPDISFVVQYNMPNEIDIYTHRIGRTGRIGQVGCALAYVGPKDRHLNDKLVSFLELNKQEVPDFLRRGSSPARDRRDTRRDRRDRGSGGGGSRRYR